jgi:hypothetical protein
VRFVGCAGGKHDPAFELAPTVQSGEHHALFMSESRRHKNGSGTLSASQVCLAVVAKAELRSYKLELHNNPQGQDSGVDHLLWMWNSCPEASPNLVHYLTVRHNLCVRDRHSNCTRICTPKFVPNVAAHTPRFHIDKYPARLVFHLHSLRLSQRIDQPCIRGLHMLSRDAKPGNCLCLFMTEQMSTPCRAMHCVNGTGHW